MGKRYTDYGRDIKHKFTTCHCLFMAFQKGNTLWKEGVKVRKEKTDKLDKFMIILADGGAGRYGDMMDKLGRGEELTKPEQEYMDRFEGWREFVKPKLSRAENKTELTGSLNLLDVLNGAKKHLQESSGDAGVAAVVHPNYVEVIPSTNEE